MQREPQAGELEGLQVVEATELAESRVARAVVVGIQDIRGNHIGAQLCLVAKTFVRNFEFATAFFAAFALWSKQTRKPRRVQIALNATSTACNAIAICFNIYRFREGHHRKHLSVNQNEFVSRTSKIYCIICIILSLISLGFNIASLVLSSMQDRDTPDPTLDLIAAVTASCAGIFNVAANDVEGIQETGKDFNVM